MRIYSSQDGPQYCSDHQPLQSEKISISLHGVAARICPRRALSCTVPGSTQLLRVVSDCTEMLGLLIALHHDGSQIPEDNTSDASTALGPLLEQVNIFNSSMCPAIQQENPLLSSASSVAAFLEAQTAWPCRSRS